LAKPNQKTERKSQITQLSKVSPSEQRAGWGVSWRGRWERENLKQTQLRVEPDAGLDLTTLTS